MFVCCYYCMCWYSVDVYIKCWALYSYLMLWLAMLLLCLCMFITLLQLFMLWVTYVGVSLTLGAPELMLPAMPTPWRQLIAATWHSLNSDIWRIQKRLYIYIYIYIYIYESIILHTYISHDVIDFNWYLNSPPPFSPSPSPKHHHFQVMNFITWKKGTPFQVMNFITWKKTPPFQVMNFTTWKKSLPPSK